MAHGNIASGIYLLDLHKKRGQESTWGLQMSLLQLFGISEADMLDNLSGSIKKKHCMRRRRFFTKLRS